MVYILLGNGFEEIEAVTAFDVLIRGGVEAEFAGIGGDTVTGAHGISVRAHRSCEDIYQKSGDVLLLPGGLGGVEAIEGSSKAGELIRGAAEKGNLICAICAGPRALAKLGLLGGKNITCYPGMEAEMADSIVHPEKSVCVDVNLITGRAPGSAMDFALAVLERIAGKDVRESVGKDLVYGG